MSPGDEVMTPIGLQGIVEQVVTDGQFTRLGTPVIVKLIGADPAIYEDGTGWWYEHELKPLKESQHAGVVSDIMDT